MCSVVVCASKYVFSHLHYLVECAGAENFSVTVLFIGNRSIYPSNFCRWPVPIFVIEPDLVIYQTLDPVQISVIQQDLGIYQTLYPVLISVIKQDLVILQDLVV